MNPRLIETAETTVVRLCRDRAGSPAFTTSLIIQAHSRALVVLNPDFHAAC
jgi:hypothetical protein